MQGVGNLNLFIKEFKLRLVECFKQDWQTALDSHDIFNMYTLIDIYIYIDTHTHTHRDICTSTLVFLQRHSSDFFVFVFIV